MTPATRKEIEARANKLMKDRKVTCDKGGCQFHSGHEFCSMDAAWDAYYAEAEEELERERENGK